MGDAKRWLWVALLLLFASDVSAQFCPGVSPWVFDDVASTHPFCTDITWVAQRGVTLGCTYIDPLHRLYCPNDSVSRGQMAAFMHRLGDSLFPTSCAAGQVMKWDGLGWTCANDNTGGGGGGGTVTSVSAGTGLQASPNPITGAGSINLAASYQLPQACAANQIAKWNGALWTCAADATGGSGTVTSLTAGSGIALAPNPIVGAGTISADTAYLQRRVTQSCIAGSSIRAIADDGSVTCEVDSGTFAFTQGGNAFGATAVLGTTDNQALDMRANAARVMRYEPNAISPNLIGGNPNNGVTTGVRGATIAGGGVAPGDSDPGYTGEAPNAVTDHYGTVSGGYANRAGDSAGTVGDAGFATVAGGRQNTASGYVSAVSGGSLNVSSGSHSAIGGGDGNTATAFFSTVGGGSSAAATGVYATVGGGTHATASGVGATVGGGGAVLDLGCGPQCWLIHGNEASGDSSTIPGGFGNVASGNFSFAAGHYSDARGDHSVAIGHHAKAYNGANIGHGTIVLADGNDFDFNIGTDNRFAVRATGGVYLALGIDAAGAATWTCQASNGNAWACASDRNLKHNLVALDGQAVLDKLVAMPIYQWQPKGPNRDIKHYGPMAQDFHSAFGLGDDERMIGMQDADGVALAAIQGLHARFEERIAAKDREIAQLRTALDELRAEMRRLAAR